jgi:hypothetical protein
MLYRLGADVVLLLHLAFILFVVFGALVAVRSRRWLAAHLGAAIWGCMVEFTGLVCPLTYAENLLRTRAGQASYGGDFVEHYLLAMIYPAGLGRHEQVLLGAAVVIVNVLLYSALLRARRPAPPG